MLVECFFGFRSFFFGYCIYGQTRSRVATRLRFWHLFDKFLISFVKRSISFAYQTQKAWNQSLSTTELWKNLLLCKKLNLTKMWAGINFHHVFTLVLKIWSALFKPEAIKVIKNLSIRCQKLSRVATPERVWLWQLRSLVIHMLLIPIILEVYDEK